MKVFSDWAIGFFVFYFIAYIFGGLLNFTNKGNFDGVFISAFVFGLVVAALPAVLGFFKIRESNGALLMGGLVVNFIFYFLGYYLFGFFTLADKGKVSFFHSSLTMGVEDKVLGLILISLVSSAIIVALQSLSKRK
ncbi:hypothetical protein KC669_04195 [Candidatus Dojkabacteria bacterium]|uniref:Uncharacterized protein n=1 Tax=Candidatus Dojkabacteria bacterium TaxID=2099670 RepID=A0A955RLL8_9BACT|nr:hypothetical protein [Candidatus Dojkabacteria bacterium]